MIRQTLLIGLTIIFLAAAQAGWAADASKIYAQKCASCHGPKGEGALGPTLKGDPFVTKGKPEEIKNIIIKGRNKMPPGLATEEEADALVKYLQSDLQK